MISFRYHLVSIIAVFLALALGIVVGTTGLNGAILSDLRKNVRSLKNDNGSLRTTNTTLQKEAGNADQFAASYAKKLLAGTLTGKTVVVVSAPGADSRTKSGIEADLTAAGAKITGKIQLSADYIDPQRATDISNLVAGNARPAGLQLPVTSDSTILAGAMLAYVLAGKGTGTDMGLVISAFTQLNMLKVEGGDPKGAQLAVVIGNGTFTKDDAKSKAMPSLVSELNRAGLTTVAAGDSDSATDAGLIASVRANATLSRAVPTVDNADTDLGQLSTVLALAGALTGTVAKYGNGSGVDSLFPAPSG